MEKEINLFWQRKDGNFGDELSPYIVSKISGQKIKFSNSPSQSQTVYMAVGSILHHLGKGMRWCEIWGSGLMDGNHKLLNPKKIHAVRGPLTRQFLIRQGINCPDIYGDPALLLPQLFNPKVEKKYEFGIVPHFIDQKNEWIKKQRSRDDTLIINVYNPVEKVIKDILSCKMIFSSSLHGLIVADAYRIPSLWIKLSNKIKGKGFKFRDYLLSIKVEPYEPSSLSIHQNPNFLLRFVKKYDLKIDLDKLLECSPF